MLKFSVHCLRLVLRRRRISDSRQVSARLRHFLRPTVLSFEVRQRRCWFASAAENLCGSKLPQAGVCQSNTLICLGRRGPCPIVTFQTERKGKLVPLVAVAILPYRLAIHPLREQPSLIAASPVPIGTRPGRQHHGKARVNDRRSGPCPRADSASRGATFHAQRSELRHSCNRFQRLSNRAVFGLEVRSPFRYLIKQVGDSKRTDRGSRRRA